MQTLMEETGNTTWKQVYKAHAVQLKRLEHTRYGECKRRCARGAAPAERWYTRGGTRHAWHTVAHATTLSKIYTIVQTERDDYANTNSNNSCYNIDSEREKTKPTKQTSSPGAARAEREKIIPEQEGGEKMYTFLILRNEDDSVVKRFKNVESHIQYSFDYFPALEVDGHSNV